MEQHVCLEQVFSSVHLTVRHIRTERHPAGKQVTSSHLNISCAALHDRLSPFQLSEANHLVDGPRLTHHVESPQAGICVAGVEGLEAVAQVALTCHLSQLTGQILKIRCSVLNVSESRVSS